MTPKSNSKRTSKDWLDIIVKLADEDAGEDKLNTGLRGFLNSKRIFNKDYLKNVKEFVEKEEILISTLRSFLKIVDTFLVKKKKDFCIIYLKIQILRLLERYDEAIKIVDKVLSKKQTVFINKEFNIVKSALNGFKHTDLGDDNSGEGNHEQAINHYKKAIEYMENIEDEKDHLISLYTNLGLEFKVFKKYSLAISNLEKAKYISQEINNTEAIFDTILNLVEVFMDQEKYVIAKSKLQEAIQIANEERDLYLFADYYTAEAKLSYKKKEIEETNIFLDKALAEDPYQADALGLKTEIQIDKKIKDYNKKVKERENEFSEQITNERVKLIEYLSVFTAIIALIFVSINIVIQFTVMDALIILAGMSIFISNFIFLLKFFLKDEYKNFLFCLLFMIAMIFILMTLKLFGEPW